MAGKENRIWKRRRRNNIVITEWRGKLKSKQQIEEDIENVIKENIEEAKVEGCYNINKDQVLVEMEEWSGKGKVMKQRGKLRENKKTEKIFIDNESYKIRTRDTEETKNHRERRKKRRERSKSRGK
jgi:hypothetical protein